MKLVFSKKILILAIGVLIIIVTLNITFASLLINNVSKINGKIEQLDISSQERERELNLRDSISNTIDGRKKLTDYFVKAGDPETVEFTKYLEALAVENGVEHNKTINYESIKGGESSPIVSAIRFKFSISGRWTNIFSFVQAVENLPKIVFINSVSIILNSANTTTNRTWTANIDFTVAKLKK